MKQIAAVCAAAALYIFTVFASARVQAQPAVQVDAPETPPAHTESAPLSTGASTTTAATVPATTRPSAPSATAPPAVPSADAWYLSSIPLSRDLQRFTYELCERLEISYPLVLGVMKVESDFRTGALRKGEGADMVGIMQINSRYLASHYKRYGVTDAYTPGQYHHRGEHAGRKHRQKRRALWADGIQHGDCEHEEKAGRGRHDHQLHPQGDSRRRGV